VTLRLKKCLNDYVVERLKPERCDTTRPGFAIARLVEFFGADTDVETMKGKAASREYRAARLAQGVVDSTIRRELSVLFAALKHAAEEERIGAVPAIKLPKDGRPRKRWYTEEEVSKMMALPMSERCRHYIYLAAGTGARKTAITTLPVKRLDFQHGFIDYSDPDLPETKKKRPRIKMAEWLKPLLLAMVKGKGPDDIVIGHSGPKDVRREVKALARAIGIDEFGVSCHAFRRTFVMWAITSGEDIKKIADAIGDRVATVERNYTEAFPEGTASVVNSIKRLA
jgi:integrase